MKIFLAVFLSLSLALPSPAFALRPSTVDAEGPGTVRAGLEDALTDRSPTRQAAQTPAGPAAGLEAATQEKGEIQRVLEFFRTYRGYRIFNTYPTFEFVMEMYLNGSISLEDAVKLSSGKLDSGDYAKVWTQSGATLVSMNPDAARAFLVAAWQAAHYGLGPGGIMAINNYELISQPIFMR